MDSIRTVSIEKAFGKVHALDGVNLTVEQGELFFLLGPSGCGKTTLLRCIAGLETPTSGKIYFGDREVTSMAPHKREAALVFQSYALWPHLTVGQNIAFGLEERKVPKAEIRQRVEEALEMVKLPGFGGRSIDQMSGGQQQRVSLARALVVKPKCLLLDEPLSNLDAQLRVEMRREIRRIVKDNGLTGIYVTHDQEEALAMADRIAVMSHGKIAQTGTPEDIYRTPHTVDVATFIGETNITRGKVMEQNASYCMVRTDGGAFVGRLADSLWNFSTEDEVRISIRPEAWRLNQDEEQNSIAGTVIERTYLGQRIRYLVNTAIGRLEVVEMNPQGMHEPGAEVSLSCRQVDVVILKP
jgi:iron(III) transport system ATP-binding protein